MKLTILMPCLNESATVTDCVAEAMGWLATTETDGEVLVVDNGSTDGSALLSARAGARVITEPRRGYGSALLRGIGAARGEYIVMGDCDRSYDFSKLSPFVDALEGGAALVMGDRFADGQAAMCRSHKIGVAALSWLARVRFHTDVRDFHSGLRAFRTDAARRLGLRCLGMEFATELVARFAAANLPIAQVPIHLRPDGRDGPSHLRTLRDGARHLHLILTLRPAVYQEMEE